MDVKKKIIITGHKVHDIGYRPFLLGVAESFEIERFFADNTFIDKKQAVYALVDSSEEKVESFVEISSSKFPEKSDVEKVDVEDYSGNVMKIESYYRYLTAMQLSKIATYGGRMLDKQDNMLDKQDKMLDKQDKMLDKQDLQMEITKNGFNDMRDGFADLKEEMRTGFAALKEDTSGMKSSLSDVKSTLSRIEVDIKDTKFSLSSFIEEKFRKQELEIAEIKATLARMQGAA